MENRTCKTCARGKTELVLENGLTRSECIGDSESHAVGYRHGLAAGIYNTLVYLEKNGYISDSEFSELITLVRQDNMDDLEEKTDE